MSHHWRWVLMAWINVLSLANAGENPPSLQIRETSAGVR